MALYALFLSNAVSLLGNVFASIALPWFVLVTTGSAARTGLMAFVTTAPYALGAIFGGTIVDRVGPRRASILSDVASGLAVAAIPILYAVGELRFWQLLVLGFAGALLDAPGSAARLALVPDLAARAGMALERANSIYRGAEHTGYLVGAPLAGLLIAGFGAPNALWVDVASFAVSALAFAVAVPALHPPVKTGRAYLREVVDGLRFIRREPVVRVFLVIPMLGNFVTSPLAPVILPVYAREIFGSAASLGVMIAAYGAGGILGAALFGLLGPRVSRRRAYVATWIGHMSLVSVFVWTPPLAVTVATLFLVGVVGGALVPLEHTVRQERTPPELRARVFSTVFAADMLAGPPGALVAGVAIQSFGLRPVLVAFVLLTATLTVWAVVTPAARAIERSDATNRPDARPRGREPTLIERS